MKKIIFSLVGLALVFGLATTAMADTKTIVSDINVNVYGPLDHYAAINLPDWGVSKSAVITWKHPSWPTITDTTWISSAYYTENPRPDSWRLFSSLIELPSSAINIIGNISITSDNAEEVYLNEVLIGSDGEVQGTAVDSQEWNTILDYSLTGLHAGTNELDIIVRNYAYNTDSSTVNPAGLIYKAEITYEIGDIIAPVVTIESPTEGVLVNGIVDIYGSIVEDFAMGNYNIAIYAGDADFMDFSKRLEQDNGYPTTGFSNEKIYTWDTTTYADGDYLIRFAARDKAGNRDLSGDPYIGGDDSQHVIKVTVKNTPGHNGPSTDKDQCKKGGWKLFNNPAFKNKGDCVSYFQSNENAKGNKNK